MSGSRREPGHPLAFGASVLMLLALFFFGVVDHLEPRTTATDEYVTVAKGEGPASFLALTELEGIRHRYSLYAALRELAPMAELVASPGLIQSSQVAALDSTFLPALGRIQNVSEVQLTGVDVPAVIPARTGSSVAGPWELYLFDGYPPETLFAVAGGGVLRVIDGRFASESWIEPGAPSRRIVFGSGIDRRWKLPGVVGDAVIVLAIFIAGALMLPRRALPALLRSAIAVPVGLGLLGTLGVLRLSGTSGLVVMMFVSTFVAVWLRSRGQPTGFARKDARSFLASAVVLPVAAAWGRAALPPIVSPDSIVYLAQARLLADGLLPAEAVRFKRGAAQQQIHAAGFALGAEGLQSIGVVVLLCGVGLLLSAAFSARHGSTRTALSIAAGVAALGIVSLPSVIILARYINSHVILAVMILALVLLLNAQSAASGLQPAIGVLIGAIVLLRPEGLFVVSLILLGGLKAARGYRPEHWYLLGAAGLAWNSSIILSSLASAVVPARPAFLMSAVSMLLFLVPEVVRLIPETMRDRAPLALLAAAWMTAIAIIGLGGGGATFASFAARNILEGHGRWGLGGVTLLMIAIAVASLSSSGLKQYGDVGAQLLLLGYFPLALLAKLGDGLEQAGSGLLDLFQGGGRLGWGDSANRMWMHVALVVLYLFLLRIGEALEPRSEEATHRRLSRGYREWQRRAGVALALIWIAWQWSPQYGGPAVRAEAQLLVAAPVEGVLHEMLDGQVFEQRALVDWGSTPASDSLPVEICAEVPFVTFERTAQGTVHVRIAMADRESNFVISAADLQDWGRRTFCVTLGAVQERFGELVLQIENRGGASGTSVALLRSTASLQSSGGAILLPVNVHSGLTEHGLMPFRNSLAMDLSVAAVERHQGFASVLDAVIRNGPRAIAIVAVVAASLLAPIRQHNLSPRTRQSRRRSPMRGTMERSASPDEVAGGLG